VNSTSASFTAQTLDSAREHYAALSRAHTRTRSTRFHTHCLRGHYRSQTTLARRKTTHSCSLALERSHSVSRAPSDALSLTRVLAPRKTNSHDLALLAHQASFTSSLSLSLPLSLSCSQVLSISLAHRQQVLSDNARKTQDDTLLLSSVLSRVRRLALHALSNAHTRSLSHTPARSTHARQFLSLSRSRTPHSNASVQQRRSHATTCDYSPHKRLSQRFSAG
jgi:hypothetical protein